MKLNNDLENLRKDMGLILNKKDTEIFVLKCIIGFVITERVYNIITHKTLFFW